MQTILMIDTETAGTLNAPIIFDFGGAIVDRKGRIYETFSFVISDTFFDCQQMVTSYYFNKLPNYYKAIANGDKVVKSFAEAIEYVNKLLIKYSCKIMCAHNANFDKRAINATAEKYNCNLENINTVIWYDTLKMCKSVVTKTPTYIKFCKSNNFMTKHSIPRARATAEIVYRYITKDTNFIESHTALEDVLIEVEILKYCYGKHKRMIKEL